jgi:cell division cycle 2-like protein
VNRRPRVSLLEGCRSIESFEYLNKIDEGAYGVVYRAMDKTSGEIVAIKKLKLEREREGFPITALRELSTLISLRHPNIINVKEVVYGSSLDKIYVVMEYLHHELKSLLEDRKLAFSQAEIKSLVRQILEGLAYMHSRWVFHRDLKTSNLLYGNDGVLKICDFGLARKFASPLRPYTNLVVTLWYRAPELLLGTDVYSSAIDMWSVGCIMAELILREPLLMGKGELDQIDKILRVFGNPS